MSMKGMSCEARETKQRWMVLSVAGDRAVCDGQRGYLEHILEYVLPEERLVLVPVRLDRGGVDRRR
eukprot:7033954-Pyramimonas_sp.AAC.1